MRRQHPAAQEMQGMGMGLAISRSIIENHGGKLWATPNDGPEAKFQFTLMNYR